MKDDKKELKKNITNFLQTLNKLSSKKKRQINKSKWKANIEIIILKKATISNLESCNKKELTVSILTTKTSKRKAKDINIAIISGDTYRTAGSLIKTQVFAVSIRDIQYQGEKKARAKTNLKSVIPQEYHDFHDIFLKKNLDTLPPNRKYDYRIHLKKE